MLALVSDKIKIRKLCKSFHVSGRDFAVFENLSLDIPLTGITAVVGASGCGKTTLLRILGGLEKADGGTIHMPDGIKVGVVFQEPRLMPWLTARHNITFSRQDLPETDVRALIDMVGLRGFEQAYPHQLSGGMQHRAALARALAYNPDMILMDEPFAALDYFTRDTLQKELLHIHTVSQKGIVLITHHIDEALLLGRKIIVLGHKTVKKQVDLTGFAYPRDLFREDVICVKQDILQHIAHNDITNPGG